MRFEVSGKPTLAGCAEGAPHWTTHLSYTDTQSVRQRQDTSMPDCVGPQRQGCSLSILQQQHDSA